MRQCNQISITQVNLRDELVGGLASTCDRCLTEDVGRTKNVSKYLRALRPTPSYLIVDLWRRRLLVLVPMTTNDVMILSSTFIAWPPEQKNAIEIFLRDAEHSDYGCCCCRSPSRSTTTLQYYELSDRWAVWIWRWLCYPNSDAQTLLQWGQHWPAFGLAVAAWRAARRFIEVLAQQYVKSLKPASHTVLHTSLSLAEASNSKSWMLHFCKATLIWSEKTFLYIAPPVDRCSCDSSP